MKKFLLTIIMASCSAQMDYNAKIYVAGHCGLVGSALIRELNRLGYSNIITRTHQELDLARQADVEHFFEIERPEYVFLSAAKVGGIKANMDYPASFIYENLAIEINVIHSAYKYGAKKLLFLGSSCIYPRECPQPILEEYLLTKPLEKTNEAYALAKISGLKMCQYYNKQYGTKFISCMPTNLYGPNDNYDLEKSHVLPALIRKFVEAKDNNADKVIIWGTGSACREFLHVDDLANACIFLMNNYNDNETINIGSGQDITIKEIVLMIKELVGYDGELIFDTTKPDGTPKKLLNINKIKQLGWKPFIELKEGLEDTIQLYFTSKGKLNENIA